jgi:hypothetical protein
VPAFWDEEDTAIYFSAGGYGVNSPRRNHKRRKLSSDVDKSIAGNQMILFIGTKKATG